MFNPKTGWCILPVETFKELCSLFEAIDRALAEGKQKVARELCRSELVMLTRVAAICLKRKLSAAELQDLLRQASYAPRAEDAANRAV